MIALDDLEQIAHASDIHVNKRDHRRGSKIGRLGLTLKTSHVAREKQIIAPPAAPNAPTSFASITRRRASIQAQVETFYAEVSSAAALRDAFRARVEQLNISRRTLDEVCGLTPGHAAKLLVQTESKNRRCIGPLSLDLLLPATGLKLVVVDDRAALAKVVPKFEPRNAGQVRLGNAARRSKGSAKPKPKLTKKHLWNGRRDPR